MLTDNDIHTDSDAVVRFDALFGTAVIVVDIAVVADFCTVVGGDLRLFE